MPEGIQNASNFVWLIAQKAETTIEEIGLSCNIDRLDDKLNENESIYLHGYEVQRLRSILSEYTTQYSHIGLSQDCLNKVIPNPAQAVLSRNTLLSFIRGIIDLNSNLTLEKFGELLGNNSVFDS